MIDLKNELTIVKQMVQDSFGQPGTMRAASRAQVLAIILALKPVVGDDRDDRLKALNALLPAFYGKCKSTNDLDMATAGVLIGWLYGLAPGTGLQEGQPIAPHVQEVLEQLVPHVPEAA